MVDNILYDALSCPHLGDQIRYPAKNLLDELTGELDNPSKRKVVSYLTVRSEISIQSYASRMDGPAKEMGVPFLPPGVKKVGR